MAKESVGLRTRVDKKTGEKTVDVRAPLAITVKLTAKDGTAIEQTIFATINSLPDD